VTGARSARAVLIAGPTASGKTRLAIERAGAEGAAIVNADSMQVYSALPVLTAQPRDEERTRAPHHLFGHVAPARRYSVGDWLADVGQLLPELAGRPVIFVGGTGLYFEALLNGLQHVPPVPVEVRDRIAAEIADLDAGARRALLEQRDPKIAARLKTPDPQRIVRALGVLEATGRSLADWQAEKGVSLLDGWQIEKLILSPPREILNARIAQRFAAMLDAGAVEEAKALLAQKPDPTLPVMKAIGLREIGAWLKGEITRDQAVERATAASRQYAKRQLTWFRKFMNDWEWLEA
jgi:tRNA dimethylallyltransferase